MTFMKIFQSFLISDGLDLDVETPLHVIFLFQESQNICFGIFKAAF